MNFFFQFLDITLAWLILFIVSMIIHELGHGLVLKSFTGKKPEYKFDKKRLRFTVGSKADYTILSPKQKMKVYAAGILLGSIIIILASLFSYVFAVVLIPYVMGCKHDIQNIKIQWKLNTIAW